MLYTKEEFKKIREKISGNSVVFTNGCFDILHRGHIEYLNEAKSLGDYLVIGLNSDKSVKKLKGEDRPVNNEIDRAFVLSNLKCVDAVIIFEEETPYDLISSVKPDFLVKGGDWKEDQIVGSDIVKSYGGKVISLKFVDSYSTSDIIERIKKQ
jgi:D-glycero-beta-D-manno-heptose 1-phosphate adenylyltransferase